MTIGYILHASSTKLAQYDCLCSNICALHKYSWKNLTVFNSNLTANVSLFNLDPYIKKK